jgi:Mce-associated membrane protein
MPTEATTETEAASETEAATETESTETESTETEDQAEAQEHEAEKPEPSEKAKARKRRLPGRATLGKAALALVLAASVGTAGLQWNQAHQSAEREHDRRAVRASAGEFGQALLSYDHRNLQAARNRVLSLSSEDFAKTYDVAFTGGLESVITRLKASATATVRTVYLGDIDASSARAIVVLDSEVRSSAGTRRVLGSHLDMRLARKGEGWRVTEVTSIGAADETMTDPQGKQQGTGAPLPTPSPSSGD